MPHRPSGIFFTPPKKKTAAKRRHIHSAFARSIGTLRDEAHETKGLELLPQTAAHKAAQLPGQLSDADEPVDEPADDAELLGSFGAWFEDRASECASADECKVLP